MKKLLCLLICALLTLGACALAEGGQLPLAASLEAYLPSVWHPFTASDEDGDGYNDTFTVTFDDGQGTAIEASCQCFDGAARVVCDMGAVGADADVGTVCQVVNALNANGDSCRWWYDEEAGVVRATQEIYDAVGGDFGAYAFYYMNSAATYVYFNQADFMELVG